MNYLKERHGRHKFYRHFGKQFPQGPMSGLLDSVLPDKPLTTINHSVDTVSIIYMAGAAIVAGFLIKKF